jgi:hypothetical protein
MASFPGFWRSARVFFSALALFHMNLYAQSATGGLRGTVRDSTSAVIAGANVTVMDEATNIEVATVTNGAGLYAFPVLAFGTITSLWNFPRVFQASLRSNF